jgi:uncharacterized protein YndB with AHSA1/START domain
MDRYVTHATFSLERSYPVSAARVFAAWADPAAKARWFAPGPDSGHQLDFRVGGREVNHGGPESGPVLRFESFYRDIVPEERIVYSSTLSAGNDVVTVSVTTVELSPVDLSPVDLSTVDLSTGQGGTGQGGTRLVLTEQGTFLDGREEPDWRERGTAAWLDALGAELSAADPGMADR